MRSTKINCQETAFNWGYIARMYVSMIINYSCVCVWLFKLPLITQLCVWSCSLTHICGVMDLYTHDTHMRNICCTAGFSLALWLFLDISFSKQVNRVGRIGSVGTCRNMRNYITYRRGFSQKRTKRRSCAANLCVSRYIFCIRLALCTYYVRTAYYVTYITFPRY